MLGILRYLFLWYLPAFIFILWYTVLAYEDIHGVKKIKLISLIISLFGAFTGWFAVLSVLISLLIIKVDNFTIWEEGKGDDK